jgi:hypothetical protein
MYNNTTTYFILVNIMLTRGKVNHKRSAADTKEVSIEVLKGTSKKVDYYYAKPGTFETELLSKHEYKNRLNQEKRKDPVGKVSEVVTAVGEEIPIATVILPVVATVVEPKETVSTAPQLAPLVTSINGDADLLDLDDEAFWNALTAYALSAELPQIVEQQLERDLSSNSDASSSLRSDDSSLPPYLNISTLEAASPQDDFLSLCDSQRVLSPIDFSDEIFAGLESRNELPVFSNNFSLTFFQSAPKSPSSFYSDDLPAIDDTNPPLTFTS